MIKSIVTLTFLICSIHLIAQDSDYLIMMNGDKVNVKVRSLGRKDVKVKLENGKKIEYSTDQNLVKEIYWKKKKQRYQSIAIELSNPLDSEEINVFEPKSNIVDDNNRFLPLDHDGRIKIFRLAYYDTKNQPFLKYFISKDGAPAYEIPDVVYNFRSFVNTKNSRFFRYFLKDCPQLAAKFGDDTKLIKDELYNILDDYNTTCPNKSIPQ